MRSLHELQRAFGRALFEDDTCVCDTIVGGALDPVARLDIYRHNVDANLRDALAAVYPVVQRLVGEGFFRYAAQTYIQAHPSRSGDVHDFGYAFPDFLAGFPAAGSLPYLPDTARLEWHVHEAFHAPEHEPVRLEQLAAISPAQHGRLVFKLHPACRLLASEYPLHRIWEVNQPGHPEEVVHLAEGGARLLIHRPRLEVQLKPLCQGEFAFLERLAAGHPIGDAVDPALMVDDALDVPSCLKTYVLNGTLVDVSISGLSR